ncbi:hypothetical protein FOMPIDRAFT_1050156 [Fomitopsis schrenkii]|uniref:Uncharacterized protein n=1 Tax=Fomitopsis schrenkii TaxID=2126942 RepID=S8E508_FOMSC|nr:hypothetical protein FOMPIDRAFT_1050156 [Fomitopsis schrenkii]
MSLNSISSYSRRSSTASSASASTSLPSLSPSTSVTPGGDSTCSLRSYPLNGLLAAPTSWRGVIEGVDKSPVLELRICEEDPADLTQMSLDELCDQLSNKQKGLARIGVSALKDHSEHRHDLHHGHSSLYGHGSRHGRGHHPNDSISFIDMRDLPPLNERDDEIVIPVPKTLPSPRKKRLDKELPPLPTE